MSITIDDDFDFIEDGRRDTDDEGPALRADYVPLEPFENGKTFGAGIGGAGKEPEPFLTVRDPSLGTIDWNRFIRPATPEEIRAYDEWEEQRAKQGMGAVISQVFEDRRQAWEQTPDQAAHRLWLERQTGISQRMLRDPDVLRTAELRAQMDMDALTLHDAPEQVLSWLKTPGMLEIARDDLETLKKVGDALQRLAASKAPTRLGGLWKGFRSGIANVMEGAADRREMKAAARMSPSVLEPEADIGASGGVMGLGRGFLASLPKELRKDVSASMSRSALSNAEGWRGWADAVRPEGYVSPKEGTFYRWLHDIAQGTPYTLAGMPVSAALTAGGAALGGPLGATAGAALSSLIQTNDEAETEQAQVWRRLVDEGMDPAEAYDKSFREVYLPNFGLLYLSNFLQDRLTFGVPLGRGAAYWAKRGGNFLLASLFEGAEEIGQSLIANRALGEANDWGQLLYEGLVGVGVGMVFGGGGAALDTAIGRYREHRSEDRAAEESARIGVVMDEAAKAAEASKVRERSPEAFDDFVEYIGEQGQEKVNVDGAVFFQTFGEDAAAAAERLGVRDQLEEAAQTGGAVEITTAAILQNPDLYEKVKDDLRYSDDGMSRNEAQEYERTRGERFQQIIGDAAAAERTVQEAGEKAERIRDGLRAQFEALGHKKIGRREAEFYSTLWTAALANEARYAGMSIEEMARRPQWNVRFQFDKDGDVRPGGEPLAQPVNPGVNLGQKVPILDLSDKIPDARKATPQELLELLKTEFVGKEPNISADGEAMIGLPSNSMAKHVVRSSWKGLTYEDMDTRTAGLMSLRDVLQNSTLIERHPNRKPIKKEVKEIHRFYVPVWTHEGLKTLRIVAHERQESDGRVPIDVSLYDVIVEGGENESSPRLSGSTLSSAPPARQLGGALEITIADMLRGVKDAEGRLYVGEEYRQTSPRQSPDYDPGDPQTWPPSAERNEAIQLEAWSEFDPDGEVETWPESPEKTEALALQKEYREIEAWIDGHSVDEVLANNKLNERGVAIEERLRELGRDLKKQKPKGIEKRLSQLIDAEEEAAARELGEAEEYYQSAYHGSPHRGITKMSLQHIGTGEGAQAYGYGLYFAENRDVAQDYRVALGGSGYTVGGKDINLLIKKAEQGRDYVMAEVLGEIAGTHKTIEELRQEYTEENGYDDADDYQMALNEVARKGLKGDGQLYRLEVPENDVLLDWDKPISEQPEKVKKAVQEIAAELSPEDIELLGGSADMLLFDGQTGQQLYAMLAWLPSVGSDKAASMLLLKHGVPGLRYLDQGSRRAGKGTYNFVVWDENAISVEETYYQQAEAKLAQDEKAWATLLDRFLNNELTGKEKGAPLPVMTTPLVLSLTGVEVLPVEIHARNLDKILHGKHGIAPETLKQIPRAITDPIMIFRSPTDESKGRDSRVILTELTEKDADGKDRNIVAAITLERANTRHGYEINELTTVFRKDISSKQQLTPELDILDWMTRRHKDGSPMNLLLYLNRKKGLEWLDRTGTSPKASSLFQDPYVQSVPNEADLDKARTAAQGLYQDASSPLGYARFEEAETIVAILKDGNRSTFLHELGHVLLNSRLRLALMEGVDDAVREDWTRLVEWLEVADVDFSKPLSEADEKRWKDAHEKFATGFEKYLMEGKAPSADLARAFRAFRKWLLDIYKAVRNIFYVDADGNRVGFEINDEIRSVMDRMLATEEEIEASRAVREAERLAYILSEQGIPDDVATRYRDVIAEGTDAAKVKLMKKLAAELKAEKQVGLKEARKQAKKRAGAEVWDLPEYRALKALLTPRAKGGLRLSVPVLTELYGDTGAESLMRELPVGVLANDGISPEAAAELLGYGTPEELLEDLKRAKTLPPQKAIADRVRAATAQLESLIHDPEALRAEAERILHDRERLEWLALETEMLDEAARRAGKRIGDDARKQEREQEKQRERASDKKAEEDLRGVFGPENLAAMAQAAEAEAKRIIAGKRMRDISVPQYMAAEKRASAKALQAAASARFDEARQWKWTELVNHALAIEAMRVREEYEKGKKQLERYWPNRKRLRGVIGNEAFGQIVGLLERLGVNQPDPRAKDRPRLDEYLNTLAQKRETTPPVARWLRDLDIRDARASLANLNPEQFEDVMIAIGALDRIGRLDNKLLTAQSDETFTETVERLRAETEKRHGLPGPQSRATDQKGVGLFAGALASLDRVETLLRQADGLEEQGAFWETIYLPAQRAHEAELVKGKAAKEAIAALFDKHFKDKKAFNRFLNEKHDTGMIDPGTGKKLYWSGENLLCAMLNWGNQHNRERLVFGNGLTENALKTAVRPADDAQYYAEYEAGKAVAETIFNRLSSDAMWDFCQDVWDYLDTFWPEIQALEERLNGAAPEKVEALPVRTASGKVLRGGYYPVRFDANADWTAFVHNEQETVKALYEDQTHRPGTRKGHTKERVERVAPRQLLLSLDVIAEHTANVVRDLTHREAVRDLYKLIHDDTVRGLLTHAVGRAGFEQFSPWIQSLAAPSVPTDKADRVFSKAMGNAAAVQLGLNVVSSVGQTVSLVPAAWKLGLRRIVPAILNTLTLRGFWDSKYRDFAFALSPELADRINGTDRNIRAALELERNGAGKRALSGAKATLYVALGWADMAVSLPVWHAAYEKGMARWDNQRKAVDYANYIVRTTNNTGAAKDLAQVQRGGPTRRLFTMYYSAFGSLYQMFHEQMSRAGREGIPGKIKLAAFCFMMFTVQSALEDLVKGRAPLGDDEDDDSIEKWLLRGTFSTFSSMFPIVRDIASGTTLLGGTGKFRPSPALEAGAAFVKAIDSGARFVADIWDGEDVEADRVVRDMVMAGGYAFGLPSVQLLRWYKTFVRWTNDEPDWSPWELIWAKRGR